MRGLDSRPTGQPAALGAAAPARLAPAAFAQGLGSTEGATRAKVPAAARLARPWRRFPLQRVRRPPAERGGGLGRRAGPGRAGRKGADPGPRAATQGAPGRRRGPPPPPRSARVARGRGPVRRGCGRQGEGCTLGMAGRPRALHAASRAAHSAGGRAGSRARAADSGDTGQSGEPVSWAEPVWSNTRPRRREGRGGGAEPVEPGRGRRRPVPPRLRRLHRTGRSAAGALRGGQPAESTGERLRGFAGAKRPTRGVATSPALRSAPGPRVPLSGAGAGGRGGAGPRVPDGSPGAPEWDRARRRGAGFPLAAGPSGGAGAPAAGRGASCPAPVPAAPPRASCPPPRRTGPRVDSAARAPAHWLPGRAAGRRGGALPARAYGPPDRPRAT